MFIGGEPVEAISGEWTTVVDPAKCEALAHVPSGGIADVDRAVAAARAAFNRGSWRSRPPVERAAVMDVLADLVERNAIDLAELETAQTGAPIKLRRDSDMPFAVDNLRFFATAIRHAQGGGAAEYSGAHTSMVRREPVGVVGQIVPWNYPFLMAVWRVGPAPSAGNSVVLKPAMTTPLTALRLAELARDAGLPAGVLNVATGPGAVVGAAIASHADVQVVSVTGDLATGKKVQALASTNVKRVHLELGGKAPVIVHADADLQAAVRGTVVGRFVNVGQDCTAATLIYVDKRILEHFVASLLESLETLRVGDPSSEQTDMGCLIGSEHLERVHDLVERARAAGARVLTGGTRLRIPDDPGPFYAPTVIDGAAQESEVVQREVFGPVLTVTPFDNEDDALRMANDIRYGLASSVWTSDVRKAHRAAMALDCGAVWVNDHLPLVSEMPHGGFGWSGYGKDLSAHALDEYTRVRHVMIALTGARKKPWHYTMWGDN